MLRQAQPQMPLCLRPWRLARLPIQRALLPLRLTPHLRRLKSLWKCVPSLFFLLQHESTPFNH